MAKQQNNIDLGLAVLCILAEEGQTLTNQAIAEVCDCSSTRIDQIVQRAKKKVKAQINLYDHVEDEPCRH